MTKRILLILTACAFLCSQAFATVGSVMVDITTGVASGPAVVSGFSIGLIPTAVKTSAYNAVAGDFVPVDTTSASVTITLPTAPANNTKIGIKQVIRGGTNVVTYQCGGSDVLNKAGGSTSGTLTLSSQAVTLQYKASGAIWYVIADDLPYGSLLANAQTWSAVQTFSATPVMTHLTVESTTSTGATGSGKFVFDTQPQLTTGLGIGVAATTGNSIKATEASAPSGASSNDLIYPDSTAHRWKMNNNNGGADTVVGAATTDTFTNKTFDGTATGNSVDHMLTAVTEANSNPITDDGTTITPGGSSLRQYVFFTLPSTEKLYRITGIEWKNGATVNGNTACGISTADASPPVLAPTAEWVWGVTVANSGTNAVQRQSNICGSLIPAGTLVAAWIQSSGTTHTYKGSTVASNNNRKTISFGTQNIQDTTAWGTGTTQPYMKIYYIGYR